MLAADLIETLETSPGVGLAAPQIGVALRVVVVDVARKPGESGHGRVVLVDPVLLREGGDRTVREGCLSVPEYTANVRRASAVTVSARDERGRAFSLIADGLEAVAIQHEIDHLDGILFLDRVANVQSDLFRRRPRRRPEDVSPPPGARPTPA